MMRVTSSPPQGEEAKLHPLHQPEKITYRFNEVALSAAAIVLHRNDSLSEP